MSKDNQKGDLIAANKEIAFQKEEKEKRVDELVIANKELDMQSKEIELREDELLVANIEIDYQNEEKNKRAEELIISNKEQDFKNEENEKLVSELNTTNIAQELDINKLKRAELEIKLKNEQLEKLLAEKDKFFSIIAHDLRGPFTGFLGFTDLLKTDINSLPKEELQDLANRMYTSASSLFRMLTNLLEWSMSQRDLTTFNPEKISLNELIKDSLQIFYDVAKNKGIGLKETIPEDIFVSADKAMLNTIIRNLVSNAVKFTNNGGVILVTAKISGDMVDIHVADNGIGMNEELVSNLFRIDKKTGRIGTGNEPSTGLGLLLCKEFVEKHKGKISVASDENKGSVFSFSLPLFK
jgi:signal transduction histidine kinase